MKRSSRAAVAGLAILAIGAAYPAAAAACPFCGSVKSTFAQEIRLVDAAVIGRLISVAAPPPSKDGELSFATSKATFEIVEVLKGSALVSPKQRIEIAAPFLEDKPVGTEFLIEGSLPAPLVWTPPVAITPRSHKYLSALMKLPADVPQRLIVLMPYLQDKEDLLASDAYDEFAKAPYAALQAIKDKMPHDLLVEYIRDPKVPPTRRRLYLTMLGVCGGPRDLPMLEGLLLSQNRNFKAGLDASVACYLVLRGIDGLPYIEQHFLGKSNNEYADINAVVMALRILGQQKNGPIPRSRVIQSMRLVLDHPLMADQVIGDLARWHDWSVMDRLVTLFKNDDPDASSLVRVPVVTYLRLPAAEGQGVHRRTSKDRSQGGSPIGNALSDRTDAAEFDGPTVGLGDRGAGGENDRRGRRVGGRGHVAAGRDGAGRLEVAGSGCGDQRPLEIERRAADFRSAIVVYHHPRRHSRRDRTGFRRPRLQSQIGNVAHRIAEFYRD